jgi:uncharacterized RDD family membrane protein YckC
MFTVGRCTAYAAHKNFKYFITNCLRIDAANAGAFARVSAQPLCIGKRKMEIYYPNFNRRVKAALVDSLIFALLTVLIVPILAGINSIPDWLRIILILSPFFILEPVLVSYTGGSPGHHLFKTRIRNIESDTNIGILSATVRFLFKLLLGLLSLFFILFTKKHQAIHDLVVKSIVVLRNPEAHAEDEVLKERTFEEPSFIYPSIMQRILVPLVYFFALALITAGISGLVISEACLENNLCSSMDDAVATIAAFVWIIGFIYLMVTGLNGRLYGCRRKDKIKLA